MSRQLAKSNVESTRQSALVSTKSAQRPITSSFFQSSQQKPGYKFGSTFSSKQKSSFDNESEKDYYNKAHERQIEKPNQKNAETVRGIFDKADKETTQYLKASTYLNIDDGLVNGFSELKSQMSKSLKNLKSMSVDEQTCRKQLIQRHLSMIESMELLDLDTDLEAVKQAIDQLFQQNIVRPPNEVKVFASTKMTTVEEIESKGLPYGCDYAKTGRSSCKDKDCKGLIDQFELRMSARTRSNFAEGLQDNWFHFDCFWKHARRGINEASIRHFEHLRWGDQEKIRARIQKKDEHAGDTKSSHPKAEYAKSGRSNCMECKEKIANQDLRIEFRSGFWHPNCLAEKRFYRKLAEDIENFDDLEEDDQKLLRDLFTGPDEEDLKKLDAGKDDEMTLDELKLAKEEETDQEKKQKLQELEDRKEALKAQTDLIWEAKEAIYDAIKAASGPKTQKAKKELVERLIEHNGGSAFEKGTMEDHVQFLADILVFGGFAPCPECESAGFYYSPDRRVYQCALNCNYFSRDVKRKPFESTDDIDGLSKYEEQILLPAGRVFSKSVEEHAEEEKLISIAPKPVKKVELSRKRKKEPEGTMKENGFSVDPHFALAEEFHVYVEDGDPYQYLLHKIDEKTGDTKFYKMQLLEGDDEDDYRVFRRYGVVMADKSRDMIKECKSFDEALKEFEKVFRQKAGFPWSDRHEDHKKRADKNYSLVEWNVNLSGTYGRASNDTDDAASVKKIKKEEEEDSD